MWNPLKYFKPKTIVRTYAAADMGRLFSKWAFPGTSADAELYGVLSTLRFRSRELSRNNDYARKYLQMLKTNVIGPNGIILQNKARQDNGDGLDKIANDIIEEQWKEWGKKGNCTVDGRLSWVDVQNLFIESVARDGEILIRKVKGWDNKWRFALEILEPDYLDEEKNDKDLNIVFGVQLDQWHKPIKYWILKRHPGDRGKGSGAKEYNTVGPDELLHCYRVERPEQTRGIPWMVSAMTRLRHLGEYEEAELVAARVGAAKMGFYTTPADNLIETIPDKKDADGNVIKTAEPGTFEQLPPGFDFKTFEPEHPQGTFPDFMKCTLRGIAAGLNISYNSLANDLESVNYSSYRAGALEERDNWKSLQSWMCESFCAQVFHDWLYWSLVSKAVNLPASKFDKLFAPSWRPRGWAWVDPAKDSEASRLDLQAGFTTKTNILAEQGFDLEEIYEQLKLEKELEKLYSLEFDLTGKTDQQLKQNQPSNQNAQSK